MAVAVARRERRKIDMVALLDTAWDYGSRAEGQTYATEPKTALVLLARGMAVISAGAVETQAPEPPEPDPEPDPEPELVETAGFELQGETSERKKRKRAK